MVLKKHEIEAALSAEHAEISSGRLKEDNPLDSSEDFRILCEACRRGDLKLCQEKISQGVNINARDQFDYTPLILASLCGHYEVVQLLLESGALCERDTFQGERCLYNALNDRIRNLLLSYDYSKSTDPLQPLAAHVLSLLSRSQPSTTDITVTTATETFHLHKFLLSVRSPYFARKLAAAPDTSTWKLPASVPVESFRMAVRYLYLGEVTADLGDSQEDQAVLAGVDKLSKQLEMPKLFDDVLEAGDRRLARQRRTEELERGRSQLEAWFRNNVLGNKIYVEQNVLLCAEETMDVDGADQAGAEPALVSPSGAQGISSGTVEAHTHASRDRHGSPRSVLFPVHRAMLLRSDFFLTMFSSGFREAQETEYLQVIPMDCSPEVLEVVLTFLYTEKAEIPLHMALDVLFAADHLFIEKLKTKAAMFISTLGNGTASVVEAENPRGENDAAEVIDIYEVVRAGWDTRVHRLEEFGARYIAYRLERYIDQDEFAELVRESASRIRHRQETDTVELIDDIRFYLSERFRLRMEDSGFNEMMDDNPAMREGQESQTKDSEATEEDSSVEGYHASATNGDGVPASSSADGQYAIWTLDGEVAGDEFMQDAMNYQILLGKIDALLDRLQLDA